MTTDKNQSERNRDVQDGTEIHVFGRLEYTDASGATVDIYGSGTKELKVPVVNFGYGFNLSQDYNAEVLAVADGSDVNQKLAMMVLPRDKQRKWGEGHGGIQNPTDPTKAVEFNDKRTHITEANAAITPDGLFEIKDGVIYVRADIHFSGDLYVSGNIYCAGTVRAGLFIGPRTPGPPPEVPAVPGFDP